MQKILCVGEIVNTHGVRGELKVVPLLDEPKDLLEFSYVFIDNKKYDIESVRFHKDFALVKLKEVNDMDVAQKFKQKFMELPREELKPLPDGRYYLCDLIGLKVIDKELGELGTINEVMETVSNYIYVVQYKGKPLCIPIIDGVVEGVNLETGIINVVLPKGLI